MIYRQIGPIDSAVVRDIFPEFAFELRSVILKASWRSVLVTIGHFLEFVQCFRFRFNVDQAEEAVAARHHLLDGCFDRLPRGTEVSWVWLENEVGRF